VAPFSYIPADGTSNSDLSGDPDPARKLNFAKRTHQVIENKETASGNDPSEPREPKEFGPVFNNFPWVPAEPKPTQA